jgi:uncharacterized membrane protein
MPPQIMRNAPRRSRSRSPSPPPERKKDQASLRHVQVKHPRFSAIDALRGFAVALMVAYHFCFDLNYYGWIQVNLNDDPFWLKSRTIIVSLFLCVVGISLVLANRNAIDWRAWLRRLGILAGCAALVSTSSYTLFPQSWIFFGVLHFVVVASVLGLVFLRWPRLDLAMGIILVVVGSTVELPFFNQPSLQWLGLMTYKPFTEDYVPLLPWFGVVLIGLFLGRLALREKRLAPVMAWKPKGAPGRSLAFAGRHSLLIYMLHQPLLMGVLYLLKLLGR